MRPLAVAKLSGRDFTEKYRIFLYIFPYKADKGASIYISDFSVLSYMTIESRSVFSACFVKIETRKVIAKRCDTKLICSFSRTACEVCFPGHCKKTKHCNPLSNALLSKFCPQLKQDKEIR